MTRAKIKIRLPDGSQQSFAGREALLRKAGLAITTDYESHKGDSIGNAVGEGRAMNPPEPQVCLTLIPYDKREGFSLGEAADLAGKSAGTIRNWCIQHGLGRRVGGGTCVVSKVAFAMFLDDAMVALTAYQSGDRSSALVAPYFKRFNLSCQKPQSSQSLQCSPSLQCQQP
jgi:hypothetical protein